MPLHKFTGTIARMWGTHMPDYFVDSLVRLCLRHPDWNYEKTNVSWHEAGRNDLAGDKFLGDWLFMLDTDHCFAPDVLERLLRLAKKHKAQVISGIYQYKFPPHHPVAGYFTSDGVSPLTQVRLKELRGQEVEKIGVVGGGCFLIHRDIINKVRAKFGEPFQIVPGLSEDYSFCWKCKELDIPVYLALNVECHHSISTMLSVDDLLV